MTRLEKLKKAEETTGDESVTDVVGEEVGIGRRDCG